MSSQVTYADIERAAHNLADHAHRTPVVTSQQISKYVGAQVFFKCENLQRVGAFKFRGAFHAVRRARERDHHIEHIVGYSSGNHAQALALAGALCQIPVTIVMPHDAPAAKRAATEGYGATIAPYDRYREDRAAIAESLAQQHNGIVIPPFDHPDIIAGQGTATAELLDEVGPLDAIYAPCGGGGLLSGTLVAARTVAPDCRVIGVEPAARDVARRSLRSGTLETSQPPRTIADGAQTPSLGALPLSILSGAGGVRAVDEITAADDSALVEAMALVATRMKLVIEPTAGLGLAAVLARRNELTGKRIGVILSGGNVDTATLARLLRDA